MPRWFNTAGPCQDDIHYILPPTRRLPTLERLIAQRSYFVLHAPRQVGKTTAMIALGQQLTASGKYSAAMVSVETGAAYSHDPNAAEQAILNEWQLSLKYWLPLELHPPNWQNLPPGNRIAQALSTWAETSPRPIVLFVDEIDALRGETLISVLRQLRSGYPRRPQFFPQSIGLIGLRDVRDYKLASGGSERLNTSSPFNVKVESLSLRDFTTAEVIELYQQHTDETGRIFTPESLDLVFVLTQGQPWLVNAIARQLTEFIAPDPATTITAEMVETAKEILIRRQDTHLDSLAERLQEDRVKAIIQPMLAGLELGNIPNDDIQFVLDLGLCKMDPQGGLTIANPIYREVLPRVLTVTPMASLPQIAPSWLNEDGGLNINTLLGSFLDFWLQHGEPLLKSTSYPEIAPHLVLMAFLHRVINGGGSLEREYAIGRDRMDLCLRYGTVTLGIELKVWRTRKADPLVKGLEQLDRYLARLDQSIGWLVIFDRRDNAAELSDRLVTEIIQTDEGRTITVIRA
jgi:type II secretory pathway predicted ATPase ExeA